MMKRALGVVALFAALGASIRHPQRVGGFDRQRAGIAGRHRRRGNGAFGSPGAGEIFRQFSRTRWKKTRHAHESYNNWSRRIAYTLADARRAA